MKKITLISFINTLLFFSFHLASPAHAQSDNFNYSTPVALILQVEGGGHIFQRPDYDEPRNFFIIIYGIVSKYAIQMQPQYSGLTLDLSSLPIEEKILLINHESQKLLLLGDHWIGDGERFAIMGSSDYDRLKELFAETREHRGEPSKNFQLAGYTRRIHKIWADDPDDFYREYYFPDPKAITNTTSPSTEITTTSPVPGKKIEDINIENKTETDSQSAQRKHEKRAQEKQKAVIIREGTKLFSDNKLTNPAKGPNVQHNPVTAKTAADTYSKPWLWIFLLATVLAIGLLWCRQIK